MRILVILLIVALASSCSSGSIDIEKINDISKTTTPHYESHDNQEDTVYMPKFFYFSPSSGKIKTGVPIGGGLYIPFDGGGLEWGY